MEANPKAGKAKDTEWGKLWDQNVWDGSIYKNFNAVRYEAQRNGAVIHLGKLFGICVQKGSELPDDDPRKKYKYRVVFQGNRVVDQNMDEAQFQDLGSAPATVEASRLCILKGLIKGNRVEQADAQQAYIQAKLGGTETWEKYRGRLAGRMEGQRPTMQKTICKTNTSPLWKSGFRNILGKTRPCETTRDGV